MSVNSTPNTLPKDAGEWMQWVSRRLRVLERHRHGGPDVPVTTSGELLLSVASGWTIGAIAAQRSDNTISFSATITRSGATIAAGTGNISNVLVATFLLDWRPAVTVPLAVTGTGGITGACVDTAGQWVITALDSGVDWATGTARSLGGTWVAQRR